jgi:hypothetical protein
VSRAWAGLRVGTQQSQPQRHSAGVLVLPCEICLRVMGLFKEQQPPSPVALVPVPPLGETLGGLGFSQELREAQPNDAPAADVEEVFVSGSPARSMGEIMLSVRVAAVARECRAEEAKQNRAERRRVHLDRCAILTLLFAQFSRCPHFR